MEAKQLSDLSQRFQKLYSFYFLKREFMKKLTQHL